MVNSIGVFIVEDNINTVEYLSDVIGEYSGRLTLLGHSDTCIDAIKQIKELNPDIVLMDIMLKNGDGFKVLDSFDSPSFEVIFISGFNQYMEKAIEYYAFSFITKPIDKKRLIKLLDKYINLQYRFFDSYRYELLKSLISYKGDYFLLNNSGDYLTVKFSDIVYCKASGNFTNFIFSDGKKLLIYKSLGYYSGILEPKGFFRANRSELINLAYVKSIHKKTYIILKNGEHIRVSKGRKMELSNLIDELTI